MHINADAVKRLITTDFSATLAYQGVNYLLISLTSQVTVLSTRVIPQPPLCVSLASPDTTQQHIHFICFCPRCFWLKTVLINTRPLKLCH